MIGDILALAFVNVMAAIVHFTYYRRTRVKSFKPWIATVLILFPCAELVNGADVPGLGIAGIVTGGIGIGLLLSLCKKA